MENNERNLSANGEQLKVASWMLMEIIEMEGVEIKGEIRKIQVKRQGKMLDHGEQANDGLWLPP